MTRNCFAWKRARAASPNLNWTPDEDKGDRTDTCHDGLVVQPWGHWHWPLTLSSPERAILELLDELPNHETFHQADMLMEGMATLSPRRLQKLLEICRSVKVKRLFLFFADRHPHAWVKRLDKDAITLGTGKRMLVKGGKLNKAYQITVPEEMDAVCEIYRRQAALLIRVLPYVAEEKCFALKGGTAINLFIRNMPRLSVDIDLTYIAARSTLCRPERHRRGHEAHCRAGAYAHQRGPGHRDEIRE